MRPLEYEIRLAEKNKAHHAYDARYSVEKWQGTAREALRKALRMPAVRGSARVTVEWTRTKDGIHETRFRFVTEGDLEIPAHLLVPADAMEPRPLVICLQGHSTGMHISLGREKYPGDGETIAGDRDLALQAVSRGCAALAMEQRGFGELSENPQNGCDDARLALVSLQNGRTLIGERAHDVLAAIEAVRARFPEADTAHTCVMGNSGGGTTALYAAAVAPEIAGCLVSCAFSGFAVSIAAQAHCACNYIPDMAKLFDMGDLACLIAPRPLVIVSATEDAIFPVESAKAQFETVRRCYEKAGASELCRHVIAEGGHRFYRDLAWGAFEEVTAASQSL